MASQKTVTLVDVLQAAKRIASFAHRTPMLSSETLDELSGRKLYFKCELFQKTGSFKFRGAMNSVLQLTENNHNQEKSDEKMTVVTHSSGNHGQALALAAKCCGINSCIVMPITAPAIKKAAVLGYGAKVVSVEATEQARESAALKVIQETPNSHLIHPYNHPHIMAGQGTMAVEMLDQVSSLDTLVVPVGGGGMLSGICIAAKTLKPDIKIFAAEPARADGCAKSFAAGKWIPLPGPPDTIADGLKTSTGSLTWPIIHQNIEDVITVTEEEIASAMRLVWERMKLLVEPSAAVGVAAVLSERFKTFPQDSHGHVGIVLCGGNVDLDKLPWIN